MSTVASTTKKNRAHVNQLSPSEGADEPIGLFFLVRLLRTECVFSLGIMMHRDLFY